MVPSGAARPHRGGGWCGAVDGRPGLVRESRRVRNPVRAGPGPLPGGCRRGRPGPAAQGRVARATQMDLGSGPGVVCVRTSVGRL